MILFFIFSLALLESGVAGCTPGATRNDCNATCTCGSEGKWGCIDTCPAVAPSPGCKMVAPNPPTYPNYCCPVQMCPICTPGSHKNDCNTACTCSSDGMQWACVDTCPYYIPPPNCSLVNPDPPIYPNCCPTALCENCASTWSRCNDGDVCNNCNARCTCQGGNWGCVDTCPQAVAPPGCFLAREYWHMAKLLSYFILSL